MRRAFTTKFVFLLASALVVSQAGLVDAGFVSINVEGVPKGNPPGSGPPEHAWNHLPDGNARLVLGELFNRMEFTDSYDVRVSGVTNNDPVLTITKNIENNTGSTWFGYDIGLDPLEAATFVGTATSDTMTLLGQTAHSLTFGLPAPVPSGESVSFTFDINIPSTGPFAFTLSQLPNLVPEPATTMMLGIGLLFAAVASRRRHR